MVHTTVDEEGLLLLTSSVVKKVSCSFTVSFTILSHVGGVVLAFSEMNLPDRAGVHRSPCF